MENIYFLTKLLLKEDEETAMRYIFVDWRGYFWRGMK